MSYVIEFGRFKPQVEGVTPWEPGIQLNPTPGRVSSEPIDPRLIIAAGKKIEEARAAYRRIINRPRV